MKRSLLALPILALASFPAGAATLYGLQAGVGQWYINLEGDVGQSGSTTTLDDLGFQDQTSNVVWAMIEHPIPVLPNIRLMHSSITAIENSITSQRFTIGGLMIDAQVRVLTDMDLSHTDATFYYELLDNWVTLDLGITARYMAGYVDVLTEVATVSARADLEGILPMGYINFQLDLPASGWHFGFTGHGAAYRGDKFTDTSGRIGYLFELTPLMEVGINVGHRVLAIRAEEFGDLYADAKLSGSYVELVVNF
jgi:outer membrane protein